MSTTRQTKRTARRVAVWIGMLAAVATWGSAGVGAQRDRGVNQPGAVGNRPAATPAGYGGSARQVRAVNNPGFNQPGAAGNRGVRSRRQPARGQGQPPITPARVRCVQVFSIHGGSLKPDR